MNSYNSHLTRLIKHYHQKGVLLDTNVLLLLLIGLHDPDYIEVFKKTNKYKKYDFSILFKLVAQFNRLIVTPHILAEVTSGPFRPKDKRRLVPYFDSFRKRVLSSKESHLGISKISTFDCLHWLGVTDTSLVSIAQSKKYLPITSDGRLAGYIERGGYDIINFEELRISIGS